MSNRQMTIFTIFADGASCYTLNLASATWLLNSPMGDLVSSGDVFLGPSTNNLAEYHAVIGLLMEALDSDVRDIKVYLDSELVVQQLNWVYTVRNPRLLRTFGRVRLLERYFEKVTYQHVLRHLTVVVDSLANYVLDWYIDHN